MINAFPRLARPTPALAELSLRNFKAFGGDNQSAPMSPITLIYGPNSGGKSSVIQALLLLKQSEGSSLPRASVLAPRGEYVDLAGFKAMVHRHKENEEFEINVKFKEERPNAPAEWINIDLTFGKDTQHYTDLPILNEVRYELGNARATDLSVRLKKTASGSHPSEAMTSFDWADGRTSIESYVKYVFKLLKERLSSPRYGSGRLFRERFPHLASFVEEGHILPNEDMLSALEDVDLQARSSVLPWVLDIHESSEPSEPNAASELMDHLARIRGVFDVFPDYFQGFLEGMAYLGPILDDPRRYYLSWGGQRFTVGTRGEHTPDIISYDEEVRSKVNEWFTRFSIPYQIENRLDVASGELTGELSTLPLRDTRTETIVTPVDVGFGISQILPVIVEAVAGKSKTICVDQPEVHLHPRLQAEIAELLIDTFQNQSKRWIVETHSELLVLRIQTAIAEKRINPSDVSVLYVNPPPEQALQGEGSTIQALEIDEDGDFLSSWPEGFFEDGHAERMARLSSGR